jgi:hypothetical protein
LAVAAAGAAGALRDHPGGIVMGTCPKCKMRIRKNGNHVKLGSVWLHKRCPTKGARAAKTA